jgi:hypothetical protein
MANINQNVDGILIPLIRREYTDLLEWLRLVPRPSLSSELLLFLSIDNEWHEEEKNVIKALCRSRGCWFREIDFIDCQIPENESVYLREDPPEGDPAHALRYGHKSGPNKQFFIGQKRVIASKKLKGSLLQIEVDAFPLNPLWIDALNQEIEHGDTFVLAGSQYLGESELLPDIKYHINGNAVYGHSHPSFCFFLAWWEAALVELVTHGAARHLAYDVFLEWADYYKGNKQIVLFTKREFTDLIYLYRRQSRAINSLINMGGKAEAASGVSIDVNNMVRQFPRAEIVHCRAIKTSWVKYIQSNRFTAKK